MEISKQDQRKAADVVAYVIKLEGDATYEFILRVIALADALCLEDSGTPMGGVQALEDLKNPLETHVKHMVLTGGYPYWDLFIVVQGDTVRVVRDPGGGLLSEYDEEILLKALILTKHKSARKEYLVEAAAAGVAPTEEEIKAIQTEWDKPFEV